MAAWALALSGEFVALRMFELRHTVGAFEGDLRIPGDDAVWIIRLPIYDRVAVSGWLSCVAPIFDRMRNDAYGQFVDFVLSALWTNERQHKTSPVARRIRSIHIKIDHRKKYLVTRLYDNSTFWHSWIK